MSWVTQQEQVSIALNIRQPTPKMWPNTTLRVVVGISPKLAGHEHPVAGMELLVDSSWHMLAEGVKNSIPTHIVRVTNVVNLQFPVHLLDACHSVNAS
jgi:hypothetical protein